MRQDLAPCHGLRAWQRGVMTEADVYTMRREAMRSMGVLRTWICSSTSDGSARSLICVCGSGPPAFPTVGLGGWAVARDAGFFTSFASFARSAAAAACSLWRASSLCRIWSISDWKLRKLVFAAMVKCEVGVSAPMGAKYLGCAGVQVRLPIQGVINDLPSQQCQSNESV